MNLAVLWKLPILFVCENNGYAEFTSREEHSNVKHVSAFAAPYGMPARTVDGNDLLVVHAPRPATPLPACVAVMALIFSSVMTYRMAGHFVGDAQHYRSKEELAAMQEKDPIERLKRHLIERGVPESELVGIGEEARQEVVQAVERARAAPQPDPATVMEYVYSAPSLAGISG